LAAGQTFGARRPWRWHQDAAGKTCAYVLGDLTGVGMQGPKGAAAEGRMAAVAMVANPVPDDRRQWANPRGPRPQGEARYLAGLHGMATLGPPLRRQAAQVGMEQAQRWIALSDGGAGLEDFLRDHFGRVEVVILDFYHVAERLHGLAQALHPADEAAAAAWAGRWCHRLKHEGGAVVREELAGLDLGRVSAEARELHRQALGYFENQVHRMDYPTYRAKGWQIGSGPVEAACKHVVGQRLKGSGMRWGEEGAEALCHLRALFCSEAGQWDAFWQPSIN
jgi:hypothetical protein